MNQERTNRSTAGFDKPQTSSHRYQVRLGASQVAVWANDRDEALKQARRCMGEEMPRLWDVIYQSPAEKFEIREEA